MDTRIRNAVYKVKGLMEGDSLPFLLDEMKKDLALKIVHTNFNQKDEREELYMLTRVIDEFKVKLQEYVNLYDQVSGE